VASETGNTDYQNQLILSVLSDEHHILTNAYKTHPIEKRINMLNQQTHTKMNKRRTLLTISFTCLIVIFASFSYSANIDNQELQEKKKPKKILEGKITDKNGKPLSMTFIQIKDTKKGVVTNKNGEYKLALLDKEKKIIVSKDGYKTQEISVKNNSVINIQLIEK
jgi:hypothetical protein